MKRIAIIGAGTWGTALGIVAARAGNDVCLWSRNGEIVESINHHHVNSVYLTKVPFPRSVRATNDFADVLTGAELIILAAPSHAVRDLFIKMSPSLNEKNIIVSATKGIEVESGKRVSQIVNEVVAPKFPPRFVCLSGPSFAKEVVEKHPTAIVAASNDRDAARLVQSEMSFENLRIYTNDDVVGTEIGGSVKNVMAIAAGMASGLGYGTNTIAALITRGLAEITRLALHEGGKIETLIGLAGLGDLVLTCTGSLSRNRFVGQELGKGKTVNEITSGMNEIAEGIRTTRAVKRLADSLGIDMPITNEVSAVIYDGKSAREAVSELMTRRLREEGN
jgi:glycerol-3-phosphate dehydrogenase (NAD(P)+)